MNKEDLKIGMYVRTKNNSYIPSEIAQIIKMDDKYIYLDIDKDSNVVWEYPEYIEKASFDVIDLMKENDLAEIEYYSQKYNKRVTRLFEITNIDNKSINFANSRCNFMLVNKQFANSDKELKPIFKSIITCEQREQMSYKLGE